MKQDELTAVEARIVELNRYKEELVTQVAQLKPAKPGKDLDALDKDPQSLEEALTGG